MKGGNELTVLTFSFFFDFQENMEMGVGTVLHNSRRDVDITEIPPRLPPRSTSVIVSITGEMGYLVTINIIKCVGRLMDALIIIMKMYNV